MPFQSAKITEWKYIDKSIKYTCLFFLYSLWSVKIHAVIQTSKEIDRVCIIGFRFLHTKQRIYKCNEPGTTSKTNGTAKQKKQSKQLLREYRKANGSSGFGSRHQDERTIAGQKKQAQLSPVGAKTSAGCLS